MKCPKCGSDTRMMVQTCITAPGDLHHNLPKAAYRRKDVELKGVLWETADFICTNDKCGHVTDGYGNYVTKLEKKANEREATVDALKAVLTDSSIEHLAIRLNNALTLIDSHEKEKNS
jgi:hypothetical protein